MAEGLPFGGFVLNRMHWCCTDPVAVEPPRGPDGYPDQAPAGIDPDDYEHMVRQVWELHRVYSDWARHDRDVVDALREWFGDRHPYREVPDLHIDLSDLGALGVLESYLV